MKLTLQPNPTFNLPLSVPIAGQLENADLVLTVKHLPKSALDELVSEGMLYTDFAVAVVVGWDMDAPFNQDNLLQLLDNYPQLGQLIFEQYGAEYYKAAEKN